MSPCVQILMTNKYLSINGTSLVLCSSDADKCKAPVSAFMPAGVVCEKVSFSVAGIVDGIPLWAINDNKWFTVNALSIGSVDISFTFNDGTIDTIHADVTNPGDSSDTMQIVIPKEVKTLTLIIQR